ncbi:hypothetical protein J8273_8053 [Carpediemonas membranifera]|uniref:Uncharacterized protein n=1 Tax=Carpediemonas membranifera TaxID=201153 RepID=A0A8J6ARV0_9EUKA|nr:hypothetical protein J8273_8053 [Carpediemonas membranifera]|eukprot:KAG9390680.1 hypothetical protein J8273_8053 [Carpediemonas membranifera]
MDSRRTRPVSGLDGDESLRSSSSSDDSSDISAYSDDSVADPDWIPSDVEVSCDNSDSGHPVTRTPPLASPLISSQDVLQSEPRSSVGLRAVAAGREGQDKAHRDDHQDFEFLLHHDRLSHLSLEASRRAVAGYLVKFNASRDTTLSHAAQLRQHLMSEAKTSGPDTIGKKGHWICKAAPLICDWTPPQDSSEIIRSVRNVASTTRLTARHINVNSPQMLKKSDPPLLKSPDLNELFIFVDKFNDYRALGGKRDIEKLIDSEVREMVTAILPADDLDDAEEEIPL